MVSSLLLRLLHLSVVSFFVRLKKISAANIPSPDLEDANVVLNIKRSDQIKQEVQVDSTCNICLKKFAKKDIISYSSNAQCNHIFHKIVFYIGSR